MAARCGSLEGNNRAESVCWRRTDYVRRLSHFVGVCRRVTSDRAAAGAAADRPVDSPGSNRYGEERGRARTAARLSIRTAFRFGVELRNRDRVGAAGRADHAARQSADHPVEHSWSPGEPNQYGAVVRKTMLRLAGCIRRARRACGDDRRVAELRLASGVPRGDIRGDHVWTYVSQSDEWLGYAGVQAGITFLIATSGSDPPATFSAAMAFLRGIVLGVLAAAFVFLVFWPEYASDKLIQRLAELVRTTLAFGRQVAGGKKSPNRCLPPQSAASVQSCLKFWEWPTRRASKEGRAGQSPRPASMPRLPLSESLTVSRLSRADGCRERTRKLSRDARESCSALEQGYCSALDAVLGKLERPIRSQNCGVAAPLQLPPDLRYRNR